MQVIVKQEEQSWKYPCLVEYNGDDEIRKVEYKVKFLQKNLRNN